MNIIKILSDWTVAHRCTGEKEPRHSITLMKAKTQFIKIKCLSVEHYLSLFLMRALSGGPESAKCQVLGCPLWLPHSPPPC